MPSREEMIRALEGAESKAGRVAPVAPSREEMIKALEASEKPEKSGFNQLSEAAYTGLRSGLETATLGLSEPVLSGIDAAVSLAKNGIVSDGNPDHELTWDNLKKAYQGEVALRRKMKDENPTSNVVGSLVGAFSPAGPGAAVAKGATRAVEAVAPKMAIEAIKNPILQGGAKILKGGATGAVVAGASAAPQNYVEEKTGFLKEGEAPSVGETMLLGAKWGAGLSALPQAYKAGKWMSKRAMSVALGPKVATIDSYLANADRINSAKSVEDIKGEIDSTVAKLSDDVANKKLTHEEAQKTLDAIHDEVKATKSAAGDEFDRSAFDVRSQFMDAKQKLNDAVNARKESLRAVPAPLHLAGDVQEGIGNLRRQVSEGSSEAFETLNPKDKINLEGAHQELLNALNGMKIKGKLPVTEAGRASYENIKKLAMSIFNLPKNLSPQDAKKLVMQIDQAEKIAYQNGGFSGAEENAYKSLRRAIDAQLKNNDAYKLKMGDVAKRADVLSRAKKRFGDVNTILSKLNNIHRETNAEDRALLKEIGDLVGQDMTSSVDEYARAQETLSDPTKMRQIEASLPESENVSKIEAELERIRHPDARPGFINQQIERAGLPNRVSQAEAAVSDAAGAVEQSQSRLEPFRPLSNPATSEAKIHALMRENPKNTIETRRMFENLDEASGTNLSRDIEDRRILDSFEKGNTNGSRNVNMFSIMGHSVGAATGGLTAAGAAVGGPIGAIAGAATGAIVDRYGPQIAKGILDQVLKIQGLPTVQKINALNIPNEAKAMLKYQLVRHQGEAIRGKVAGPGQKPVDEQEAREAYLNDN